MNKLFTLAKKFETKLGLASEDDRDVGLPKRLQKIAKIEQKLQKKIAQQHKTIDKISEEVKVKTASGKVPGIYLVCNECEGRGKVIISNANVTIKLASINDELPASIVVGCDTCKGKRVVKVADIRKCSESQVVERAQYIKDKKTDKKKKKAAKAVAKAEKTRIRAENPMAWQAAKLQKKANKKAKKAAKKAMKAIDKAQKAETKFEE